MRAIRVTHGKPHRLQPGEYTRVGATWFLCTPNGLLANLANHTVIEEADGTLTVSPSILVRRSSAGTWHGWLERGDIREDP